MSCRRPHTPLTLSGDMCLFLVFLEKGSKPSAGPHRRASCSTPDLCPSHWLLSLALQTAWITRSMIRIHSASDCIPPRIVRRQCLCRQKSARPSTRTLRRRLLQTMHCLELRISFQIPNGIPGPRIGINSTGLPRMTVRTHSVRFACPVHKSII